MGGGSKLTSCYLIKESLLEKLLIDNVRGLRRIENFWLQDPPKVLCKAPLGKDRKENQGRRERAVLSGLLS